MHIKSNLFLMGFAIITAACSISTGPVNNSDFGRVQRIEQFEGTYQNAGDGGTLYGESPGPFFLSRVIWPNDNELEHYAIDLIEVRKGNDNALVVKAITGGIVVKESTFIEGKDFVLKEGRIRLTRHFGMMGSQKGDPMVGPYYLSKELGIDSSGEGKYRKTLRAAVLGFMVIPMAFGGDEDIRFVRIKK